MMKEDLLDRPLFRWFAHRLDLLMLDLDGTLVDSVADIAVAVDRMRSELGLSAIGLERVRNWVGRGAEVLLDKVMADAHPSLRSEASLRFAAAYRDAVHVHSTVYPGVEVFLRTLKPYCTLVCITNKPMRFTQPLLDSLGLSAYFSLVLAGDSLKEKKPHPQALLYAMNQFGVAAAQALMIGDSRNDVQAAHAAGVRCIALNWGYNHGEPIEDCAPDWIVNTIDELL